MKTERRHELQTNDLADWLGKHFEQIKPYFRTIVGALLMVLAAAVAGLYMQRDQAAQTQLGWNDFFHAFGQRNADELADVANRHAGTEAAVWAKQAEADLHLAEGIGNLYINRDLAAESLERARAGYETVEGVATERLLQDRALFGLAQVHESLSEIDEARKAYSRLAARSPETALGRESERRLAALEDPATEKWYNWFANQKPRPPAATNMPPTGGPSVGATRSDLPFDLEGLPGRPDLSIPATSASPDATPSEPTPPATPETPPGEETPAKPADENAPTGEDNPAPEADNNDDAPAEATPDESPPGEETPAEPADENAPSGEDNPAPNADNNDDAPAEDTRRDAAWRACCGGQRPESRLTRRCSSCSHAWRSTIG